MRYNITRECWNENTYNGYKDSPYWRIKFQGYEIGLTDGGEFWSINGVNVKTSFIISALEQICSECKLRIKLLTEAE